jgi:hypothetical protein
LLRQDTGNSPAPATTATAVTVEEVEILKLMEQKRKLARRNGLYQFVLWREAFRQVQQKVNNNADQLRIFFTVIRYHYLLLDTFSNGHVLESISNSVTSNNLVLYM